MAVGPTFRLLGSVSGLSWILRAFAAFMHGPHCPCGIHSGRGPGPPSWYSAGNTSWFSRDDPTRSPAAHHPPGGRETLGGQNPGAQEDRDLVPFS